MSINFFLAFHQESSKVNMPTKEHSFTVGNPGQVACSIELTRAQLVLFA